MPRGRVSFFDMREQCGIIKLDDGQSLYFKAHEDIGHQHFHEGKRVDFEIGQDKMGAVATNVKPLAL